MAAEDENGAATATGAAGASHLDHALLESLFYNEMALLDASSTNSDTSTDFISQHLAEATAPTTELTTSPLHPSGHVQPHDSTTLVEKEILRDFGVGTPQRTATAASNTAYGTMTANPVTLAEPWQHQADPAQTGPINVSVPQHLPPPNPQIQYAQPTGQTFVQTTDYGVQYAASPGSAPRPTYAGQIHPPVAVAAAPPVAAIHPHHAAVANSTSPPMLQPPPPLRSELPSVGTRQVGVQRDKARQLVDQFATLASRLGIDLPDTVLQSLTTTAAKNDPSLLTNASGAASSQNSSVANLAVTGGQSHLLPSSTQDENDPSGNIGETVDAVAPTVEELRKTAEEAIAAVTRKRSFEHQDSVGSDGASNDERNGKNANESTSGGTSNKPTYSKRRKKPRLAECEAKLARLKARK